MCTTRWVCPAGRRKSRSKSRRSRFSRIDWRSRFQSLANGITTTGVFHRRLRRWRQGGGDQDGRRRWCLPNRKADAGLTIARATSSNHMAHAAHTLYVHINEPYGRGLALAYIRQSARGSPALPTFAVRRGQTANLCSCATPLTLMVSCGSRTNSTLGIIVGGHETHSSPAGCGAEDARRLVAMNTSVSQISHSDGARRLLNRAGVLHEASVTLALAGDRLLDQASSPSGSGWRRYGLSAITRQRTLGRCRSRRLDRRRQRCRPSSPSAATMSLTWCAGHGRRQRGFRKIARDQRSDRSPAGETRLWQVITTTESHCFASGARKTAGD